MRWMELCIDTPETEIDARCEQLAALGCGGFIIENERDFDDFIAQNRQFWGCVDEALQEKFAGASRIKFYLADDDEGREILKSINAALGFETKPSFVADSDWENNWREYYQPVPVGEKLVIVPEWLDAPDASRIPVRLEPGLTFGTGDHPTTKLALEALEEIITPEARVLDLGCGSGILGIAALLLGAKSVLACDIDPMTSEIAPANAALNGIGDDKFSVRCGDVLSDASLRKSLGAGYDIVLANIVADVIIPLARLTGPFMASGAHFIVSGIFADRTEEVEAALRESFKITAHRRTDDWHAYICRLP